MINLIFTDRNILQRMASSMEAVVMEKRKCVLENRGGVRGHIVGIAQLALYITYEGPGNTLPNSYVHSLINASNPHSHPREEGEGIVLIEARSRFYY